MRISLSKPDWESRRATRTADLFITNVTAILTVTDCNRTGQHRTIHTIAIRMGREKPIAIAISTRYPKWAMPYRTSELLLVS